MAQSNKRNLTRGNERMDYTKIQERLKELPPVVKATMRNAVSERRGDRSDTREEKKHIDTHRLERLSNVISNNINAAEDLRGITPYIDKAELIWNTLMFYPNGYQDRILTRDTQTSAIKNTALHEELLKIWDDYFTNDYKIEGELPKYNSDLMWNTGSYCIFNLSRPGLDYLINGAETRPGDDGGDRSGNEAYLTRATEQLNEEFIQVKGQRRMKNKGGFVRDPNVTDPTRVSGIESLLGNNPAYFGTEFDLFPEPEKPEDRGYLNITMTDNPAILYLQRFNRAARAKEVERVTGVESLDLIISSSLKRSEKAEEDAKKKTKPNDPEAKTLNITTTEFQAIQREIYPQRNPAHRSIQYVKPNDSLSVAPYGQGLRFHIPSEAVFLVHLNGNLDAVRDIIVMLDDEGNFLKNTGDIEFYQSKSTTRGAIANKPKQGDVNNLIANLKTVASGTDCDFDMTDFIDVAKNSLLRQITSSIISDKGENISITMSEEASKIWLARMFRQQGVRCLYIPGESVTYMAYRYNRLGIGQSLTTAAKLQIARLAAFDVADALANIAAATPHTQLEIDVPKEIPDPEHLVAIARQTFFDTNPRLHNLLSTAQLSVPQIVDSIRESSLSVKVNSGDNPHLPTPNFTLSHLDKDIFRPVDQSSRDNVQNQIANYFHLPKSWLDISDEQNNFKIEAVTEHDMVLNQRTLYANALCRMTMDSERKHARVHGPFMNRLVDKIRENEKLWVPDSKEPLPGRDKEENIKIILVDFMTNLYSTLPTPASTEKTTQVTDALQAVKSLVEAWEEMSGSAVVMEQIIKAMGFDKEDFSPDEIKRSIKAVFTAEAMRRFNLPMPFDEIINEGKGGGIASLVHNVVHQRSNIGEFLAAYIGAVTDSDTKMIKAYRDKLNKKMDKLGELKGEGQDDQMGGGDGLQDNEGGGDLNTDENTDLNASGSDDLGSDDLNVEETETGNEETGSEENKENEEESGNEETDEDSGTEDNSETPSGGSNEPGGAAYDPFGGKK